MKRSKLAIVVLTLLTLILAACSRETAVPTTDAVDLNGETQVVSIADGAYTNVSAAGLAMMLENKDFPLINVHIPYEGEIESTDEFVPFNEIQSNLDKFPADKDAQVVVYCRSGSMSAQAAQMLLELGYTNVWNLDGGMIAWENSGHSLLNP
ncbi:MAG: hypothetical protein BroJett014_24670 [Planctomycetota bacterium]|nr:MAG: hypothetical protein BroJett014_24670 [Planctomycetota bacterium]